MSRGREDSEKEGRVCVKVGEIVIVWFMEDIVSSLVFVMFRGRFGSSIR